MNTELIQRWVRDERLSLADFLAGLSADDWNRDSLCDGWTVHDVLAHVALSIATPGDASSPTSSGPEATGTA